MYIMSQTTCSKASAIRVSRTGGQNKHNIVCGNKSFSFNGNRRGRRDSSDHKHAAALFYHAGGVDEIYVYVTGRCLTRKFYILFV